MIFFVGTSCHLILLIFILDVDNTRRNFCAIADRMKLPFVNIFTLDQVAHQKSLMLAATNRKQALAQSRKGEKLTAYEKFVAKLRMGS